MKILSALAGAALLMVFPLGSAPWGQPEELPLPPPDQEPRVKERIKMLRTWRLIETLDLTEEQSEEFFPLLKAFDRRQEELKERKADLALKLGRIASSESSTEKELREAIQAYRKTDAKLREDCGRFYDEVADVLTLRQQARLLVFEERFRERLIGILRDIRHGRGGMHGPRTPGD